MGIWTLGSREMVDPSSERANTYAPNENIGIGIDHYLTGIVQMPALLVKGPKISS